jgi:Cu/Ag efflux protein CusF
MPAVPARPAAGSDARGVVASLDPRRGRVKLRHGPIAKLDMPAMTMIFRVKDPRLLEQVREGDEVGFTVELEGTVF